MLVDAPCTGLGSLRRRPEARWRRQPSDVGELTKLQRELLLTAIELTRPGGVVGYVVCSPHLSETVGLVADVVRRTGVTALDARESFPGHARPRRRAVRAAVATPPRHGRDVLRTAAEIDARATAVTSVTVAVISMGGTIAMAPSASGGIVPALGADDLVASVPGLAELDVKITTESLRSLPSPSLGFADLVALSARVRAEIAAGATGVVITHGTDTIEETAFFLDLTVPADAPVVVTGAMRHPHSAGPDGPANLYAAIRVALSPAARGLGTLVVMSDEIHGARFVRKSHTSSTGAFVSPGLRPARPGRRGRPADPGRGPHRPDAAGRTPASPTSGSG